MIELGKSIDEIEIGEEASFTKTISESDVYLFAGITGDFNPLHVNDEYAQKTQFGERIAHGGITLSFVAPILGMQLPGVGTIALELSGKFLAPVKFGDTITVTAKVTAKDESKNRVSLSVIWANQEGTTVCIGETTVIPPVKEKSGYL